jgi:hypothetical protein
MPVHGGGQKKEESATVYSDIWRERFANIP